MEVPHIDIKLEEEGFMDNVKSIIKQIKPNWNDCDLKHRWFTEGISNKLLGCFIPGLPDKDMILIRVYGNKTELFIDREKELENIQLLHREGFAPPLYCTFQNGFCYGFIEGECLDVTTICDEHLSKEIARLVARLHSIDTKALKKKYQEPMLFSTLYKFVDILPEEFADEAKSKRFKELCPFPSKLALRKEIKSLEPVLQKHNPPLRFCHNDMLCNNIVHNKETDEIHIIDYEYGGVNFTPFDIGNHFNEYAGVDEVDYSLYPKKNHQVKFIKTYLEELSRINGKIEIISDSEIEKMYVQVNQFALASHLFWGIWGLIQANFSEIDFDFLNYANLRFTEYSNKKEEFLLL